MAALRAGLLALAALAMAWPLAVAAQQPAAAANACLDCHSAMDAPLQVTAAQFAADIHAQKGLTCASCHGGDPSDATNAMSPAKGFRGHLDRAKIVVLCGSCHGDAAFMRQYDPSLRTDQLAQYRTSVHGKKLAAGDTHVAICTDCHGVHGILPASDTHSTVNPVNVATTCKRCHADAAYMKSYKIPTDQYAGYTSSVHFAAMTERGDLSAPTCTTCHGNHGAAPPGVASVANVCSTCHVFQAQLFDASPHKAAFDAAGFPGCVTCHSNHHIQKPGDSMVSTGAGSVCTNCHSEGDDGFKAAENIHGQISTLQERIADSKAVLQQAAHSGMEVGEAELQLAQADDALTKARVAVHTFTPAKVQEDVTAGTAVAEKTREAGIAALRERDFRRKGLGLSLIAILLVVAGFGLYIREIERK